MSLADELSAEQAGIRSAQCLVCKYVDSLPLDQQEEWHAAFISPAWQHITLARIMERRGAAGNDLAQSVARHRKAHVR